jgi:hypothetical protein
MAGMRGNSRVRLALIASAGDFIDLNQIEQSGSV